MCECAHATHMWQSEDNLELGFLLLPWFPEKKLVSLATSTFTCLAIYSPFNYPSKLSFSSESYFNKILKMEGFLIYIYIFQRRIKKQNHHQHNLLE